MEYRTVWISLAIGKRMVLPVAGNPFLGHDGRGQPQPQTHRRRCERMQPNAAMRLRAVQEEGDAHVREMAGDRNEKDRHPPTFTPGAKTWHLQRSRFSND